MTAMRKRMVSARVVANAYSVLSSDQFVLITLILNQKYRQANKSARSGTIARFKGHLK